ncbi:MAG: hypothetical protein R3D62_14180 [Xanthobacteraceae bacterium]
MSHVDTPQQRSDEPRFLEKALRRRRLSTGRTLMMRRRALAIKKTCSLDAAQGALADTDGHAARPASRFLFKIRTGKTGLTAAQKSTSPLPMQSEVALAERAHTD